MKRFPRIRERTNFLQNHTSDYGVLGNQIVFIHFKTFLEYFTTFPENSIF